MDVDWNNLEDLRRSTFHVPVRDSEHWTCCAGYVHVTFRIDHGRIVVTEAKYDADAER